MKVFLKRVTYLLIWFLVYCLVFMGTMFLLSHTIEQVIESTLCNNIIALVFIFIIDPIITSLLVYKIKDIVPWLEPK